MKKSILIATFLFCNAVFAQYDNYIYANISEPRAGKWGQGKISQTNIEVTPKGLFAEVSLFLTFASNGNNNYRPFFDSDSVEFNLSFGLPKEASIIDSWLWIDNQTISKALLLERGIATQVYEGIVRRRQDPSILYKNGSGYYQLKVYPMIYSSERRVKISYLVPLKMENNKLVLKLPSSFITNIQSYYYSTSDNSTNPENFNLKINADVNWNGISYYTQTISGYSTTTVTSSDVSTIQANLNTTFSRLNSGANIVLQFNSPFVGGTFYSQHQVGNETFYQFGIIPSQLSNFPSSLTSSNTSIPDFDVITDVSGGMIKFRQKQTTNFTSFKSQNMYAEFGVFNSIATRFDVKTKFTINTSFYESNLSFSGNNTNISSDSMLRKQWAGLRITEIEKEYEANYYHYYYPSYYADSSFIKNRNQVLFLSLKNRVLATNTSFLALEPAMANPTCESCVLAKNNSNYTSTTLNLIKTNDNSFFPVFLNDMSFAVLSTNDSKSSNSSIEIYPNPVTTELNIKIASDILVSKIEILDLAGKIVFTSTNYNSFENNFIINISDLGLQSGVFILKVYHKNGVFTEKIVVKN